jgi:hypothetical protein
MNGIPKYRITALALVIVFGVFNVGIPIIIASCSMPGMMRGGSCPMCDDQETPSTARFSTQNTTICCTTTIIAERNTNEFVQAKTGVPGSISQQVFLSSSPSVTSSPSSVSNFSQVSPSPPRVVDIPIFTSSLLI